MRRKGGEIKLTCELMPPKLCGHKINAPRCVSSKHALLREKDSLNDQRKDVFKTDRKFLISDHLKCRDLIEDINYWYRKGKFRELFFF